MACDSPLCLCSRGSNVTAGGADGDGEDLTAMVDENGKLLESCEPGRRPAKLQGTARQTRRTATVDVSGLAARRRGHSSTTALVIERAKFDQNQPRRATMNGSFHSPKGSAEFLFDHKASDPGVGSLRLQSIYLQEHAKWASESEAPTAEAEDGTGSAILKGLNMFLKGVKTFRKFAANLAPDEVAKVRGVHVEKVFDYFDPAEQKIVVKRMTDDVVHYRASLVEDGKAPLLVNRPTPSSSRTSVSNNSQAAHDEVAEPVSSRELDADVEEPHVTKKPPRRRRASSGDNHEALTMWAVFTGHLMHRHVVDFRALTNKAYDDKKQQDLKLKFGHVNVLASVRERANQVVNAVEKLSKRIAKEPVDRLDSEWIEDNLLEKVFGGASYLDTLMLLANAARKVLEAQPVCVDTQSPARVFGDTHGHLRDVLLLFRAYGMPHHEDGPVFVFNGDFVDRGSHQLELIGVLLAFKVLMPTRVWLVRGNHEDRSMNERYGFRSECYRLLGRSFGQRIFELIQKAFEQMPLACVIDKRVLCVHGGIGDGSWTLSDLRRVKRPLGEEELMKPANVWLMNILWSDPIEDDQKGAEGVFGVHDSPRGSFATNFAWNVTKQFCARNGLSLVVRSHQSKRQSLGFDVMHDHLLMRVFSARDYEGHGNDSSVLLMTPGTSDDILWVRPQVLRSVTKARLEQDCLAREAAATAEAAAATAAEESRRRQSGRGKDHGPARDKKIQKSKTPPALSTSDSEHSSSSAVSSGFGRSRTPPAAGSSSPFSSESAVSSPSRSASAEGRGRAEATSGPDMSPDRRSDDSGSPKSAARKEKELRRNASAPAGLRNKSSSRSKSGLKEHTKDKLRKKKEAIQDSLASLVSK